MVTATKTGPLARTRHATGTLLFILFAVACGPQNSTAVATDVTTNADANANANDVAAPATTLPGRDHSNLPPVGFASLAAAPTVLQAGANLSLVLRPVPRLCIDIHGTDTNAPFAQLYVCNRSAAQYFIPAGSGRLQLYTRRQSDNAALCLSGAKTADTNGVTGTIGVSPCNAPNGEGLVWTQVGHLLVHRDTNACLAASIFNADAASLILAACDSNDVYQMWAAGDANALVQQAASINANVPVSNLCAGNVTLTGYDPNDAGSKRIVDRYGSLEKMSAYLQTAKLADCNVMFQSGGQVPYYTDLRVHFGMPGGGQAAMATAGGVRTVYIYTPFWASVDEVDQPFSLRVDTAFHHEFAHALHPVPFVPSGFVEGYANWVPFRVGLLRASEKKHGGKWTDGYSTTSFFMTWLDDQPTPHAVGARFTDQLRAQSSRNEENPNWFLPWFQQSMGGNPNQLFTQYQASF